MKIEKTEEGTFATCLIKVCDIPSANGYIYSFDGVTEALSDFMEIGSKHGTIVKGDEDGISSNIIDNISHAVVDVYDKKIKEEGQTHNCYIGKVRLINSKLSEEITKSPEKYTLGMRIESTPDENNTLNDIEVISIDIVSIERTNHAKYLQQLGLA